ncbi:MAG: hypothetical protein HC876_21565 [Chloroflexaceae bacterium]|nr:hypothetical protein [Chloroflexaceae bacterium]
MDVTTAQVTSNAATTTSTYAYDGRDQIQRLVHTTGSTPVAGFGYTYDRLGQRRG